MSAKLMYVWFARHANYSIILCIFYRVPVHHVSYKNKIWFGQEEIRNTIRFEAA